MSSPLGGFYLSAQQRKMHAEQRERNTFKFRLNFSLTCDHQVLIERLLTLEPGTSELANRAVSIKLCSSFTPTGLLKVVSDIYLCATTEPRHIGRQELYLSYDDPVTSLVAGSTHYRLSLLATQIEPGESR
ncbi:hypothetical protein [Shewanella aquimarina]|uniref:hypothetical protein n=1 Tax=Shewanella aquimarina TaxID=260365 RepID=UPI002014E197|nr:hypothetical protein [Shewanella aquimarina]MCL2910011.1 hypothetical protein [Shewanella aquimarina]